MNKYKGIITLILVSILIASSAYGMGLSSRKLRVVMDYTPNFEFSQRYWIITTSEQIQDYEMYIIDPYGQLSEYISVEPNEFKNIKPGSEPSFDVNIKLPNGIDTQVKPGPHELRVGVRETQLQGSTRTGSEAIIIIKFLYPGKYIESKFTASDAEINSTAKFNIWVKSGGKEFISRLKAKIEVFDSEDNKVATLYTKEISLKSLEENTLSTSMDTTGMKSGEYKSIATIYYDGEEQILEETFKIGALDLWVTGFTKEMPVGKISPFDINIQSRWNNKIENIYALIKVAGQNVQTPSISLESWSEGKLTGFIDATNLEKGEYDTQIEVFFGKQSTKEIGKLNIYEEVMPAPMVPASTIILIAIIIILVLADIVYVITSKKSKKAEEELEMLRAMRKKNKKKRR